MSKVVEVKIVRKYNADYPVEAAIVEESVILVLQELFEDGKILVCIDHLKKELGASGGAVYKACAVLNRMGLIHMYLCDVSGEKRKRHFVSMDEITDEIIRESNTVL